MLRWPVGFTVRPPSALLVLVCAALQVTATRVAAQSGSARFAIAQLADRSAAETRDALEAAGFRVLRALPGRRLLLERIASAAATRDLPEIAPYLPQDRLSRELRDDSSTGDVPLLIHLMPGGDAAALSGMLSARGLPRLGAASV